MTGGDGTGAGPPPDRRAVVLVGGLVVLLAIVAAGTGVLRDFTDGEATASDLFPRVLAGLVIGAGLGLLGYLLAGRLGPARAGRLGLVGGGALLCLVLIGAALGGTAGVATTTLGPPVDRVVTIETTPTTLPQTTDTLPPTSEIGFELPPWLGTILVIAGLILVFLLVLGVSRSFQMPKLSLRGGLAWGNRRAATVTQDELDLEAAADSFDDSAGALDDDDDPRAAIIAAYVRLLDGLNAAGCPRDPAEAPEEHLRRSLDALGVRPEHMRVVVEKFLVARFSTHPMTVGDRDEVRAALREAAGQLRAVLAEREAAAAAEVTA